jgi:hypothetical protein
VVDGAPAGGRSPAPRDGRPGAATTAASARPSDRAVEAAALLTAAVEDPARLEAAVTAVLRLRGLDARRGRDGSVLFLRDGRPRVRVVAIPDLDGGRPGVEITSRDQALDPFDIGSRAAVALGFDAERVEADRIRLWPAIEAGWIRRRPGTS